MATPDPSAGRTDSEFPVLQRYGVRWAVLAAWHERLQRMGASFAPEMSHRFRESREKIATGCFSTCTVGCDLGWIEGTLIAAAATTDPATVDEWLEMLGRAMAEPDTVRALIAVPVVQAQLMKCGFMPCKCDELPCMLRAADAEVPAIFAVAFADS